MCFWRHWPSQQTNRDDTGGGDWEERGVSRRRWETTGQESQQFDHNRVSLLDGFCVRCPCCSIHPHGKNPSGYLVTRACRGGPPGQSSRRTVCTSKFYTVSFDVRCTRRNSTECVCAIFPEEVEILQSVLPYPICRI